MRGGREGDGKEMGREGEGREEEGKGKRGEGIGVNGLPFIDPAYVPGYDVDEIS